MLTFWKVDWPQKKPSSNENYQSHHLLGLKIINTCNKYGNRNHRAHSKAFCAGITIKMLFQLYKQGKKWLLFIMSKILICYSLVVIYQTWPTFAYTNLLMQSSIHSRKEIKTLWKKFKKMLLVVHLSFLHAKQLLMKLLFESVQKYANLLLELLPANYIMSWCVNPCPPVFIRSEISIQKRVDSHLDKTRPAALKIWSCPISNEQN